MRAAQAEYTHNPSDFLFIFSVLLNAVGGTNVTGECECISGGCLCSWTRVGRIVILKVMLSSSDNSSLANGDMQNAVISSQEVYCCQSSVFLMLFLQGEITQKIREIVLVDPDWIPKVALLYIISSMKHAGWTIELGQIEIDELIEPNAHQLFWLLTLLFSKNPLMLGSKWWGATFLVHHSVGVLTRVSVKQCPQIWNLPFVQCEWADVSASAATVFEDDVLRLTIVKVYI